MFVCERAGERAVGRSNEQKNEWAGDCVFVFYDSCTRGAVAAAAAAAVVVLVIIDKSTLVVAAAAVVVRGGTLSESQTDKHGPNDRKIDARWMTLSEPFEGFLFSGNE